jgi:tRNA 5-methylaminomethyl-2-thiouridine biosynthesis bifunctional protein
VRRYPNINRAHIDANHPHRSTDFDDYYFLLLDPIGERQSVFIDGNQLPKRFAELQPNSIFRVGETGFGTGLTFLLGWLSFLAYAPPSARLQWVSTEAFPLSHHDLNQALDALPLPDAFIKVANQLREAWPEPIPTCHRRLFADGRIILDLHLNDAEVVFSQLSGSIDAWCLDGFSPDRNPTLWTNGLFRALAKHSHRTSTLSTFTSARLVRDRLTDAGFSVEKVQGYGGKRDRLNAVFANNPEQHPWTPGNHAGAMNRIAIVGAGLAGAWVAQAFAQRGIAVMLFEKDQPASGASGNLQGITYAKLSIEATPNSLIQMQSLAHLSQWFRYFAPDHWQQSGALLLAQDDQARSHQEKLLAALPDCYLQMQSVSRSDASDLAGLSLNHGGLFLPDAGWLNPKGCVSELLTNPRIEVKPYQRILHAETSKDGTLLTIQSPTDLEEQQVVDLVIWTNALEASQFIDMHLPLKPVRGQITQISSVPALRMPICGDAYVAPAANGMMTCGATYAPNSDDLEPRVDDDFTNLAAANSLLQHPAWTAKDILGHRVSLRTATPDYAPIVGQIADPRDWDSRLDGLKYDASFQPSEALPYLNGQYVLAGLGSRGTLTAPITAELVVSQILGEVLPVSEAVRDALAPDRFFRRQLIRGLN